MHREEQIQGDFRIALSQRQYERDVPDVLLMYVGALDGGTTGLRQRAAEELTTLDDEPRGQLRRTSSLHPRSHSCCLNAALPRTRVRPQFPALRLLRE
jgi:hypothetical protein